MKFYKSAISTASVLLSLMTASLPAFALKTDRDQPIKVTAGNATYDDNKGLAIYSGGVVITQGTTKLTGDKLHIYRSGEDLSRIVTFGTEDERAMYTEIPTEGEKRIHAYANTITYDLSTQLVSLDGQAEITQQDDKFSSDLITYNLESRVVKGSENVTVEINPKNRQEKE